MGGLLAFLLYMYVVLDPRIYAYVRQGVRSYNIFIYALGLAVFLGAYAVIYSGKSNDRLRQGAGLLWQASKKHWLALLVVACVAAGFTALFNNMRQIGGPYGFWLFQYPKYKTFPFMAALAALLFWVEGRDFRWKGQLFKALSVLAVIFSLAMTVLGLNYYASDLTDNAIYNNEATFSEIYNLYYGAPFSLTQFGIYGRYAFFYVPLLKLMEVGLNIQNIALLHTLTACLTVLGFAYFISKTVKNPMVRCLFLLCLGQFWGCMTLVTYQAVVRFFPGAMMFFYLAFNYGKAMDSKRVLAGYLLGALGIVWNLEYGLVASLSWAVYVNWFRYVRAGKDGLAALLLVGGGALGGVVAAFFLGWFLAGAINTAGYHGEFLSFRNFTIPHTNSAYMVGSLQSFLLQRGELPWLAVIGTALLGLGVFGAQPGKEAGRNGAVVFAAVAVLGGMVYYINRFHFGLMFMVYFPGIAMLALLADRILEECTAQKQAAKASTQEFFLGVRGGTCFLVAALVVYVLVNVAYVNIHRQQVYISNSYHYSPEKGGVLEEAQQGQRLLEAMMEKVPKDTPAAGLGMTEIYNRLGWDTGYHFTDAAYQTKEAIAGFEELLLDGRSKVMCMEYVKPYVELGWMSPDLFEKMDEMYDKVYLGNVVSSDYWYLVRKQ